ncbi:MAG: hypothetical protein IKD89_06200 [Clostridia bacterium]|nr:hypothetical protein [Clostridia bacterium]
MKDYLNLSKAEFRAELLNNFERVSLNRCIFTNEECVEVVMNEIGNHPRKTGGIIKKAED